MNVFNRIFALLIIVSFLSGRAVPGEVDTRYCIPFFDRFCWYMPERFLKPLRCGFDFSEVFCI